MRSLLLLPLLALSACQSSDEATVTVDTPGTAGDVTVETAGGTSVVKVGAALDGGEAMTAAELVAGAEALDGQEVLVSGTVREVCQEAGCWLVLDAPGKAPVRVAVPKDDAGEYVYTFPKDIAGATVRLAGTFSISEESVETLRHLAEDAGAPADSVAAITSPKRTLALTATGAEITRA